MGLEREERDGGQTLPVGKKRGPKMAEGRKHGLAPFPAPSSVSVSLLLEGTRSMPQGTEGALGTTRNGGKKFLKEVPTSSVCLTFSTEVTRTQSQSIKCRRVPSQGRVYSGRGIRGEGPQPGSRREQGFLWERADMRLQRAQNSAMSKETRPREA